MKVFVVRHGQTPANLKPIFHGRMQTALNETGRRQAAQAARLLKRHDLAAVYASTLLRARQTAYRIAQETGAPLYTTPFLQELDFGAFDGQSLETVQRKYPAAYRARQKNLFHGPCPGGESYAQAQKRAARFLDAVLERHGEREAVALVAHECINRVILGYLLGKGPAWMLRVHHPQDHLYAVDTAKKTVHAVALATGKASQGALEKQ